MYSLDWELERTKGIGRIYFLVLMLRWKRDADQYHMKSREGYLTARSKYLEEARRSSARWLRLDWERLAVVFHDLRSSEPFYTLTGMWNKKISSCWIKSEQNDEYKLLSNKIASLTGSKVGAYAIICYWNQVFHILIWATWIYSTMNMLCPRMHIRLVKVIMLVLYVVTSQFAPVGSLCCSSNFLCLFAF